jgi:hypothetical protein
MGYGFGTKVVYNVTALTLERLNKLNKHILVLETHPSPSRWIRVSVDLPGFNLDSLLID